jgi:hypothetical protein
LLWPCRWGTTLTVPLGVPTPDAEVSVMVKTIIWPTAVEAGALALS